MRPRTVGCVPAFRALVIAGQRKAALIDVLDQHGLPWTWEMSEEDLEARLRQFSEQVYRQFLRKHPKS